MGTLNFAPVLPTKLRPSVFEQNGSPFVSRRRSKKKNQAIVPVARLFGPAIFEASKLKVLFLGVDEKKHPGKLPRTYTLTHSDITSKLTLAISQTINNSQVLEAFVHGDGNLLKNYPELQESLVWVYFHSNIPEFNKIECWGPLVEGGADGSRTQQEEKREMRLSNWELPVPCQENCSCCFLPMSSIAWSEKIPHENGKTWDPASSGSTPNLKTLE
ncbi:hypothetical protein PTKIN_Ptkin05aG0046600 [Pterospermum kingtungense]